MKKNTSQKQNSTRFIYDPFTASNVSKTNINNLFERLNQSSIITEPSTVPDQNYSQTTRTTRKKNNKESSPKDTFSNTNKSKKNESNWGHFLDLDKGGKKKKGKRNTRKKIKK
jgi:hypothetical protein